MKRVMTFILLVLAGSALGQLPKTFTLTGDTVIIMNNKQVRDYYIRNKALIKSPAAIVITSKLVFRKGLPIQVVKGYPVQFTTKGVEIKPKAPSATIINFETKKVTVADLNSNDGDIGKPAQPKYTIVPKEAIAIVE